MKSMVPHVFRTGDRLNPKFVNQNFRAIERDIKDLTSRRFGYFPLRIPYDDVASGDNADEMETRFSIPYGVDVEVVGIEGEMQAASGQTITFRMRRVYGDETTVDLDNWVDFTLDGEGAAVLAYNARNQSQVLESQKTYAIVMTDSSPPDATSLAITLHFKYDRHQGDVPDTFDPPHFDASTADTLATLNNELDDIDADLDADALNRQTLSAYCIAQRNQASGTTSITHRVPAFGARMLQFDFGGVWAASAETITLADHTGALIAETPAITGGATAFAGSIATPVDTVMPDNMLNPSMWWKVTGELSGQTVNRHYVIFWFLEE